jgi:hypothetical protein
MTEDIKDASKQPAAAPADAPMTDAERRKASFESEQKARQEAFERENSAAESKAKREHDAAEAKAEELEKQAAADAENDDLAFRHGYLTTDDLHARREFAQQHESWAVRAHKCLLAGEAAVKMAFSRNILLNVNTPEGGSNKIMFLKGINDVPEHLADHGYLADAGAYRIDADGKPEAPEAREERVRVAAEKKAQEKSPADKGPEKS